MQNALFHPQVGSIDLKWGNEKGGLAHIVAKHPDVIADLPERLREMTVVRRSENRIRLKAQVMPPACG